MKNHDAEKVINIVTEEAKTEETQTTETETTVKEKKPFWTKKKKIVAGVIAGTIIGGILLKKFVNFDFEGDTDTYRSLVEDIITEETSKVVENVAA